MIGHLYTLLLRRHAVTPPTPENGPSGGASWLRGRRPPHDHRPQPRIRRSRRDELLFLGK